MIENKDVMMLNKIDEVSAKVENIKTSVSQVNDNISNVATKTDIQSASYDIRQNMEYNPKAHMNYNQYHFFNMNSMSEYGYSISLIAVDEQYLYIGISYTLYIYNKISGQLIVSINISNGDYSGMSSDGYRIDDDYIVLWHYHVVVISKKDWTVKCKIYNSNLTSYAYAKGECVYFINKSYLRKYNFETSTYDNSISSIPNLSMSNVCLKDDTLILVPSSRNSAQKIYAYDLNTMTITTTTIPLMYATGCFYADDGRFITADKSNIYVYNSDFQMVEYICLSHGNKETCLIDYIYRDKTYMYCLTTNILFVYKLNDLSLVGYYYKPSSTSVKYVCDGSYIYINLSESGTVYRDSMISVESGGES